MNTRVVAVVDAAAMNAAHGTVVVAAAVVVTVAALVVVAVAADRSVGENVKGGRGSGMRGGG